MKRILLLELDCFRGVDEKGWYYKDKSGFASLVRYCELNTLKSPLNRALTPTCYDGDSAPGSGLPGFLLVDPPSLCRPM